MTQLQTGFGGRNSGKSWKNFKKGRRNLMFKLEKSMLNEATAFTGNNEDEMFDILTALQASIRNLQLPQRCLPDDDNQGRCP